MLYVNVYATLYMCAEINFEAIVKNSYGILLKFEPFCLNFQLLITVVVTITGRLLYLTQISLKEDNSFNNNAQSKY